MYVFGICNEWNLCDTNHFLMMSSHIFDPVKSYSLRKWNPRQCINKPIQKGCPWKETQDDDDSRPIIGQRSMRLVNCNFHLAQMGLSSAALAVRISVSFMLALTSLSMPFNQQASFSGIFHCCCCDWILPTITIQTRIYRVFQDILSSVFTHIG